MAIPDLGEIRRKQIREGISSGIDDIPSDSPIPLLNDMIRCLDMNIELSDNMIKSITKCINQGGMEGNELISNLQIMALVKQQVNAVDLFLTNQLHAGVMLMGNQLNMRITNIEKFLSAVTSDTPETPDTSSDTPETSSETATNTETESENI